MNGNDAGSLQVSQSPKAEDFDDFFDHSVCGYLIVDPHGRILRCNRRLGEWLGCPLAELVGRRFSALLAVGGRIFYETQLAPLLRMQGFFEEVSLELLGNEGMRFPVLLNAMERRDPVTGAPLFVRLTVYKATDRHTYEQNLRVSKDLAEEALLGEKEVSLLREQFIAVLGHDLRNPLSALMMGTSLLGDAPLNPNQRLLLETMMSSVHRMDEMIRNVMDFARGRLGGGMVLKSVTADLRALISHLIRELQTVHPDRTILKNIELTEPVVCDPGRISQLLSNLLANALSHGAQDQPVAVSAIVQDGTLEVSVINRGKPIPEVSLENLFQPFKRDENRSSENGLGLGLYIAAEIARAHRGILLATSTKEETRFTLRMAVSSEA